MYKQIFLPIAIFISCVAYANPPMNYTVYKEVSGINVYSDCLAGAPNQSCSIVDPEKMKLKKEKLRNFIDQMRWIGFESERASVYKDDDSIANAKKWFIDYATAQGITYVFPTEGKNERDIEEEYQELHYVMFNISFSYIKIKHLFDQNEQRLIEDWLVKVVNVNMYSPTSKYKFRTTSKNNHYYIIASSLISTGYATGNTKFIDDGKRLIDEALDAMNDDGGWPLELKRKDKSGHYQMFMLNHISVSLYLMRNYDAAWANKRLPKLKKAELFTAKLISFDEIHEKYTGTKFDSSFDYSPGNRCTGQVWSWVTISDNSEDIKSILDRKYISALEGCKNDYLVGGSAEVVKKFFLK
jgi:hypothetical protein